MAPLETLTRRLSGFTRRVPPTNAGVGDIVFCVLSTLVATN